MALRTGVRLGPYEIQGSIGAGGMGEVYRARDTRLGRDVAIKVLPEHVAANSEALARFEREARTAAGLNDPHICSLHDVGTEDDVHYAVFELLEGETLRERLSHGALPPSKAIELATQICQGLAAAHAKGIVHRDLKPENLFLTRSGLKILDFGLAKLQPGGVGVVAGEDLSREQTLSAQQQLTSPGTAPGTIAYMSPEQARGEAADARSDIFAVGVVLFEMLSGQRPFRRDTQAETLVAILKEDPPDLTAPSGPVSPGLERIARRCLEKDPEDRFQSPRDVTFALEAVSGLSGVSDLGADARRGARSKRRWTTLAVAVLTVAALLVGVLAGRSWLRSPDRADEAPVVRSQIDLTADAPLTGFRHPVRTELALSPDGTLLVWSGRSNATPPEFALYIRRLDGDEAKRVPGTEGGLQPFFSPDGRWIGFSASEASEPIRLRKVPVEGGLVVDITELSGVPMGASWGPSGRIYLGAVDAGLRWVPAEGGALRDLTAFDRAREMGHRLPSVLPDGRTILMTTMPIAFGVKARVEAVSIQTGERTVLVEDAADARYLPTGHLVFVRQGVLMAAPFDLARLGVKATPVPVLMGVSQALNMFSDWSNSGAAQYAASESGLLVYGPGGIRELPQTEVVLMDDSCRAELLPGFDRPQVFQGRFSPDGRLFVFTENSAGLWLFDVERRTHRALQREGHAGGAIWSPDGRRLAVHWTEAGPPNLWLAPIDGPGEWEHLVVSEVADFPSSWSPDGRFLAFIRLNPQSQDVLLYRFEDGQVVPFLTTEANEAYAEFSPDGRWMAYVSNESGRPEVYVTSFPDRERVLAVSDQGGVAPAWSRDGEHLFYVSLDRRSLMSVSVRQGPSLALGRPQRVCETPRVEVGPWRGWDLHPDGRRFQFQRRKGEVAPPPPITRLGVVHNWFAELERLVPTD